MNQLDEREAGWDVGFSARASSAVAPPPARVALTEGPIGRTLLVFALPILASNALQSLNGSINAAFIGRLIGEQALTASSNANSLLFLLLGAIFGIGMAATVLVGQSIGSGRLDDAKRTVGTSFVFFGGASAVIAAGGFVFAPEVLAAMHTPAEALPLAASYLRVIFFALPGMFLYSFIMMALRGAGDSKTPALFLLLSVVLDVGLNPLLIRGVGPLPPLGIAGSALATLIAQWVTLSALLLWLYRSKHFLRLERHEAHYLRIDRAILRALIFKGVPMGLQMVVLMSSLLAMISLVNRHGSRTTAAYGACLQLWNYVQMPIFAVGTAVSSMVAQNVGARRWDRVGRIVQAGVLFNFLLTGGLVLIVTLGSRAALALFFREKSGAVEVAQHIHLVVSWSFVLFGVSFVFSSTVRATGAVLVPLLMLFVAVWVVRIPFAYALLPRWGADAIWWSFPVGSVASLVLSSLYYRFGPWRQATMLKQS